MKQIYITMFILLNFGISLYADISVKSFRKLENDMTARIDAPKIDQNGDACAIIKVVTTQTGFIWEPDGLGIISAEPKGAEYWLYVPYGAKHITIKHPQLGLLRDYQYPIPIEKATVYEMVLTTGKVITSVDETIESQWLVINTEPTDAAVYIDNKFVKTGTYQNKIKPGSYSYRVEAPLYHSEAGKVEVTHAKKEIFVKLNPAFGYVTVNTDPEKDAKVIIDGKTQANNTPCKSEALASGEHTIQVLKDMYQPATLKITVSDGQTTTVNLIMQPNFAEVTITAPSDADIYINSQKKGKGTWNGRLNPGVYSLETIKEKYRSAKQDIEVIAGDKKTIDLQPTPIYGSLDVITTPVGASISIDGKDYGTTPNTISKLLIGEYKVQITMTDYASVSKEVFITEGKNTILNEALSIKYEQTAETYFERGNEKEKLKDYKGAIIDLTKAIMVNPNYASAYISRGNQKYNLLDYFGAIIDYSNAIVISPKDEHAFYNRGYSKGKLQDLKGAIEDYSKAINIDPKYSNAYYNRGVAKGNLEDYNGALGDFTKVNEIEPYNKAVYHFSGYSKYKLKDYKGAIEDYSKAIEFDQKDAYAYYIRGESKSILKDYKGAIEDYSNSLEINPKFTNAYFKRGIAKGNLKYDKEAIEDYSKFIEIEPKDANAFFNRGYSKANLQDFKGAIEDYSKVIEIDPQNENAYINRGLEKINLQDYKGANEDYSKAIEIEPKDANAFYNLGYSKSKLQDLKGAIDDYSKAIEINPKYVNAYFNRGVAKERLKDYMGSIEDYTSCINIDKSFLFAYYRRGIVKSYRSDRLGAIADYDSIINNKWAVYGDMATIYNNKAYCLVELGENEKALPLVNKALSFDVTRGYIWDTRGEVYYNLGRYEESIKDMDKAISINKKSGNSFYIKGLAKIKLDKKDEGCIDLSKAVELGDTKADEAIKKFCK